MNTSIGYSSHPEWYASDSIIIEPSGTNGPSETIITFSSGDYQSGNSSSPMPIVIPGTVYLQYPGELVVWDGKEWQLLMTTDQIQALCRNIYEEREGTIDQDESDRFTLMMREREEVDEENNSEEDPKTYIDDVREELGKTLAYEYQKLAKSLDLVPPPGFFDITPSDNNQDI